VPLLPSEGSPLPRRLAQVTPASRDAKVSYVIVHQHFVRYNDVLDLSILYLIILQTAFLLLFRPASWLSLTKFSWCLSHCLHGCHSAHTRHLSLSIALSCILYIYILFI
jgi:hypothetical protein